MSEINSRENLQFTPILLHREEIVAQLLQLLPALLADRPVMLAYLHGSVAREQTHRESDVDIALVLAKPLGKLDQLYLELDLNVLLEEAGIPRPDVRAINIAPNEAQESIISHGILLFAKSKEAQNQFEANVKQHALESLDERNKTRQVLLVKLKSELATRGLVHARH